MTQCKGPSKAQLRPNCEAESQKERGLKPLAERIGRWLSFNVNFSFTLPSIEKLSKNLPSLSLSVCTLPFPPSLTWPCHLLYFGHRWLILLPAMIVILLNRINGFAFNYTKASQIKLCVTLHVAHRLLPLVLVFDGSWDAAAVLAA